MTRMRTIADAAKILKEEDPDCALGVNALRAMAKSGAIPCVKCGARKILIDVDALESFLAKDQVPAQQSGRIQQVRP